MIIEEVEIKDVDEIEVYKLLQPFMGSTGKTQKETGVRVGRVKRAIESEAKPLTERKWQERRLSKEPGPR
jgi:hypothetical protein